MGRNNDRPRCLIAPGWWRRQWRPAINHDQRAGGGAGSRRGACQQEPTGSRAWPAESSPSPRSWPAQLDLARLGSASRRRGCCRPANEQRGACGNIHMTPRRQQAPLVCSGRRGERREEIYCGDSSRPVASHNRIISRRHGALLLSLSSSPSSSAWRWCQCCSCVASLARRLPPAAVRRDSLRWLEKQVVLICILITLAGPGTLSFAFPLAHANGKATREPAESRLDSQRNCELLGHCASHNGRWTTPGRPRFGPS